jgi:hypothetical protein
MDRYFSIAVDFVEKESKAADIYSKLIFGGSIKFGVLNRKPKQFPPSPSDDLRAACSTRVYLSGFRYHPHEALRSMRIPEFAMSPEPFNHVDLSHLQWPT